LPKFSEKVKKFCPWHLLIMAQPYLPPWQELYDITSNDVVDTTSNTTLNGKLHAKLLCLFWRTSLVEYTVSRKDLRQWFITFTGITPSIQTEECNWSHCGQNIWMVVSDKMSSQWVYWSYCNYFHELLDDLYETEELISMMSSIHCFIFILVWNLKSFKQFLNW